MGLYTYVGTVTSVHDGDTFKAYIDLGFNFVYAYPKAASVRIYGINSPELTTKVDGHVTLNPPGEDATLHLMDLLGGRSLFAAKRTPPVFGTPGDYLYVGTAPLQVVIESKINLAKSDFEKYGRVLGRVHLGPGDDPFGPNLGAQMLADGFATLDLPFVGAEQP